MRQIKFRAYNKRMLQMRLVERIFFNDSTVQISHGFTGQDKSIWFFDHIYLMQFTGLKDSKGNDIYEHDILKTANFLLKVIYDNCSFVIEELNKNNNDYFSLYDISKFCEVIGNIHENSELLENK